MILCFGLGGSWFWLDWRWICGWCGVAALRLRLPQPPATILLIRHAEKPASGMDLAPAGFARAKVMPELFCGTAAPHNLPRPDFLFATHVSKNSNRPMETITPLSEALGLPISHEIDDKDYATLATGVAEREVCGQGGAGGVAPRIDSGVGQGAGGGAAVRSVAGDAVRPRVAD